MGEMFQLVQLEPFMLDEAVSYFVFWYSSVCAETF